MAGCRSGQICSRRDRPEPPQHQGGEALADTAVEEAGCDAEAHDHRQAAFLWSSTASGHAASRTSVAQRAEQPGGEFPPAVAKTGADDARLPITGKSPALRLCLLRHQKSFRPTPLKAFCIPHPPSSSESNGGVESRHLDRLSSTRWHHRTHQQITRHRRTHLMGSPDREFNISSTWPLTILRSTMKAGARRTRISHTIPPPRCCTHAT